MVFRVAPKLVVVQHFYENYCQLFVTYFVVVLVQWSFLMTMKSVLCIWLQQLARSNDSFIRSLRLARSFWYFMCIVL